MAEDETRTQALKDLLAKRTSQATAVAAAVEYLRQLDTAIRAYVGVFPALANLVPAEVHKGSTLFDDLKLPAVVPSGSLLRETKIRAAANQAAARSSTKQAILDILELHPRQWMTVNDIVDAMTFNGTAPSGGDPAAVVRTAVSRLASDGEVHREMLDKRTAQYMALAEDVRSRTNDLVSSAGEVVQLKNVTVSVPDDDPWAVGPVSAQQEDDLPF
jgi:hypothetical protein